MERAVYITPASALSAAQQAALRAGAHPKAYEAHSQIRRATKQGQTLGWEAWYRARHGEPMRPVMEN